jgi:hypothetical protein
MKVADITVNAIHQGLDLGRHKAIASGEMVALAVIAP